MTLERLTGPGGRGRLYQMRHKGHAECRGRCGGGGVKITPNGMPGKIRVSVRRSKSNIFENYQKQKQNNMIIMPVKEGENIEKALKKFKRKYERTGVLKELRRRQYFTKPSVAKREARQRAIYVEHTYRQEE